MLSGLFRTRGRRWALAAGIVALALVGLGVAAFQPWTANHFSYALPGPRGLPFRIHYGGRDFSTPGMCAGADWCRTPVMGDSNCRSQAEIMGEGWWPLDQVGTMHTLFGPSYPIMSIHNATQMLLFVRLSGGCYIAYAPEGGP